MVWALGFHRRPDLGDVALDAGAAPGLEAIRPQVCGDLFDLRLDFPASVSPPFLPV